MAAVLGNGAFTINEWRVDPSLNRLSRGEEIVKVDPQNMKVLELLASRPGEVFSQAEIEERAWPDVIVSPNSVYQSIAQLRRAMGDDTKKPRYIETISRKGYRCVARIDMPTVPQPLATDTQIKLAMRPTPPVGLIAIAVMFGMVTLGIVAIWLTADGGSSRRSVSNEDGGRISKLQSVPASRTSRAQLSIELGDAAGEARDLPLALRHYQVAIEEANGVYASTDPFFSGVFTKRAWIYHAQDDIHRALREAEAAIGILEKNGVPTNPLFISARSVYAEILTSFGRHSEAEQQAKEALGLAISLYGEADLHVALVRGSFARVRLMAGDWAGAEIILREVLSQFSAKITDGSIDTVGLYRTLLASTLYHQGRFKDAVSEAREALLVLENAVEFGLSASAYQILSDALIRDGDIDGADDASRKCVQILNQLAAAPWRIARAESTRAEILFRRGRTAEAKAKLMHAATILRSEKDQFAQLAYAETERRLDLMANTE